MSIRPPHAGQKRPPLAFSVMAHETRRGSDGGGSPASRGGAGAYIEGELGASYLLAMLAGAEARGLPGYQIERVRFQGVEAGYALDDVVVHGTSASGASVLEIQSKRTITFAPGDPVFRQVCEQIASAVRRTGVGDDCHQMAVATQRTSYRISGPYQDVLIWARALDDGPAFGRRVRAHGMAGDAARSFAATFRTHLVSFGVNDDDDTIWRVFRRFQILEFDFESVAPMARTYALDRARMVLDPRDACKAGALWASLIAASLDAAKVGGSLDRTRLRDGLAKQGYQLAGDRDFATARSKLDEMARFALDDIGETIARVHVPREAAASAVATARDAHRYVEISGESGVGKSALLRRIVREVLRSARALVLEADRTPPGGWLQMAAVLGVPGTARDFLADLAAGGGATLFVDGLENFADPARRATVNDLMREVSRIDGFSVVVTARTSSDPGEDDWLAEDALAALGGRERVVVGDLSDDEVAVLGKEAPELAPLLMRSAPAVAMARNPYRLFRLSRVADQARIRTEAALAHHWWQTGDGVLDQDRRARQRMLSDLAEIALAGGTSLPSREDTVARRQLLASLTLREPRRDQLAFRHDVLRDWAVGSRLHEEPELVDSLDLARPTPASLARGVEMAGRLALERGSGDGSGWARLLESLSRSGAHGSWRRHALLSIVRSERALGLMATSSGTLLAAGGAMLAEIARAVVAVDTVPIQDLLRLIAGAGTPERPEVDRSLRAFATPSARRLLAFCIRRADSLPLQSLPSVVRLAEVFLQLPWTDPALAGPVAHVLFGWLARFDIEGISPSVPNDPASRSLSHSERGRLIDDLRQICLLFARHAPEEARAYLTAVGRKCDPYRVGAIRGFAPTLAAVCPEELAALVEDSLLTGTGPRRAPDDIFARPFHYSDSNYLPSSPGQAPFLDLLNARPEVGLGLIRRLTAHAVKHLADGREGAGDGLTIVFDDGVRFFPWTSTYCWSRGQDLSYAVASSLMALEAWGHSRLDSGDQVESVISDVLGPPGGCAAYVLIAVDLILSHWPGTRAAAIPFVSCPRLLATERGRLSHDRVGGILGAIGREPKARSSLADLAKRPSRGVPLEFILHTFSEEDHESRTVRTRLREAVAALPPYGPHSDYGNPSFMGFHALNLTDPQNWRVQDGQRVYLEPPTETEHVAELQRAKASTFHKASVEAMVSLATSNREKGSAEVARKAVDLVGDDVPSDLEADQLPFRPTLIIATAMLVARDGDDVLVNARAEWVRDVAQRTSDGVGESSHDRHRTLDHNHLGLATSALVHLWIRRGAEADRDAALYAAARRNPSAAAAFAGALAGLVATDPRILKAALRIALGTSSSPPFLRDEARVRAWEREDAEVRCRAVEAEVAWLEGAPEPTWPILPEREILARAGRSRAAAGPRRPEAHTRSVDTGATALWLEAIAGRRVPEIDAWLPEVFDAYAGWTARANGLGLEASVEVDRTPSEWNQAFYSVAALVIADLSEERFRHFVNDILALPDDPFCEVAPILLFSSDVRFFNLDPQSDDRAPGMREALARRTRELHRWVEASRSREPSVDFRIGSVVGTLLMNSHGAFGPPTTYLVPAVAERVNPMLDSVRQLLQGGPIAFVALCLMNTMLVFPRARHVSFLFDAVDAWFDQVANDRAFWVDVDIGRKGRPMDGRRGGRRRQPPRYVRRVPGQGRPDTRPSRRCWNRRGP